MTVWPILSDPALDPVTTTAWAWSPDNPVMVSVATTTKVSAAKIASP